MEGKTLRGLSREREMFKYVRNWAMALHDSQWKVGDPYPDTEDKLYEWYLTYLNELDRYFGYPQIKEAHRILNDTSERYFPFSSRETTYKLSQRKERFNAIEKDWLTFHQDHQSIRRRRRNRFRHKACNEMYPGRT